MKRFSVPALSQILLLLIAALALAGCADELIQPAPTSAPVVNPVENVLPSVTPLNMPTSTPTVPPPTPTSVLPPTPTLAPLPVLVPPTANPPPPSQAITLDNVGALRRVGQIGFGEAFLAAIAPGDALLAVGTTAGLAWFELPSLQHLRFDSIPEGLNRMVFSPSGRLLATLQGGPEPADGVVAVRQVADGALIASLAGVDPVFSPDELMIATMQTEADKRKTQLWRTTDGEALDMLEGGYPVFSPNGQFVASVQGKGSSQPATLLWRSVDGSLVLDLPGEAPAFSSDGALLATATASEIALWSMPGGQPAGTLRPDTGTYADVNMAFSSDGRLLQVISGTDVQVWDVTTGTLVNTFDDITTGSDISASRFTPSGDLLAVFYPGPEGGAGGMRVLRTEDGSVLLTDDQVSSGDISDDGTLAALLSDGGLVRLVDLVAGTTAELNLPAFTRLAVSPDGQTVATAIEGTIVYRWRASDGVLLQRLDVPGGPFAGRVPREIRYSSSGSAIIARENLGTADVPAVATTLWNPQASSIGIEVWRATRGDELSVSGDWAYHPATDALAWVDSANRVQLLGGDNTALTLTGPGSVTALAFHPDGSLIALGDQAGTLQLLKTEGGYIYDTLQAAGPIDALRFSADGTRVAVQRSDGTLVIWLVDEQTPLSEITPERDVQTFLLSPNNQMLVTGGREGVVFYRINDGQLVSRLDLPAQDISISADGRLLVVLYSGLASLWGVP